MVQHGRGVSQQGLEHEVAGPAASSVRKKREMEAGTQLTFSFL